jgi:hypothetical protein
VAHPLFVPAFLAYTSRRPGWLYTSDVRQRLPGHRAPHLRGCHNRPPAGCQRRMPPLVSPMPAPTQATASPTGSPTSIPLAFVGHGDLVLARVRSP